LKHACAFLSVWKNCRKIAGILKVATDVARLASGLRIAMLCVTFYQASFIL